MPSLRQRSGRSPSTRMPINAAASGITPGSNTPAAEAGVERMPKPTSWKNGAPDPRTISTTVHAGVPLGSGPVRSQKGDSSRAGTP